MELAEFCSRGRAVRRGPPSSAGVAVAAARASVLCRQALVLFAPWGLISGVFLLVPASLAPEFANTGDTGRRGSAGSAGARLGAGAAPGADPAPARGGWEGAGAEAAEPPLRSGITCRPGAVPIQCHYISLPFSSCMKHKAGCCE